ncbi:FeoB-associated Cys-rich membrane protein [Staphylococcus simiae]|uniref:FeoB-associated Cys-rich membrane protein n=1 Tax=Staphylococcus simiae TaxID=308354 RepID=UPI001A95C94D|nr:FeoB-associated Cys-rich membrane protein [Staphylococcus simiae]MBO1198169.1 FeoB-associated Cys-rich membrane protein [Staphylococcus simiae]MBO1200287.1 FeoB-associated Cys-rich membrane protein [Staphylococcus simiae]MBO1202549.1 FeoB-associated Cys-rich membrane protein [Staphylococcus simiae]MBO1210173.1 FeoB-associated Cys-rich membrane protein [Staphylococcus simiae]MBO1228693.1 FeoB-associated Cys-rich membrane protein [Staphylococcus simiae]
MSIIVNALIFIAIFGYAIYTIVKFFKRSKQGKCGSCDTGSSCCESQEMSKELSKKLGHHQ